MHDTVVRYASARGLLIAFSRDVASTRAFTAQIEDLQRGTLYILHYSCSLLFFCQLNIIALQKKTHFPELYRFCNSFVINTSTGHRNRYFCYFF